MTRLLFVSHDASRTGAPLFLLNLMTWLRANSNYELHVLFRKEGELGPDFAKIANIWSFEELFTLPLHQRATLLASKLFGLRKHKRSASKLQSQFDLIYSNTVANGQILAALSESNVPVITHVHELDWVIDSEATWGSGHQALETVFGRSDLFIAVSEQVKDSLSSKRRVGRDRIAVIPPAIPQLTDQVDRRQIRRRLLERYGIPDNAAVICAAGSVEMRKGPDLFVQLAYQMTRFETNRPVHLIWIGEAVRSPLIDLLRLDVEKVALSDRVLFTGQVDDPELHIGGSDVFTLLSREDPFPLVCMEAGSYARPIVCFEGSGGAASLARDGAGLSVPYLDVPAMAEAVHALLENPELADELGARGRELVKQRHIFDVIGYRIRTEIEQLVDRGRSHVVRQDRDEGPNRPGRLQDG